MASYREILSAYRSGNDYLALIGHAIVCWQKREKAIVYGGDPFGFE